MIVSMVHSVHTKKFSSPINSMIIFSYEFRRQRELSVQNRNFHITSAFNKIFENLISGEIVQ